LFNAQHFNYPSTLTEELLSITCPLKMTTATSVEGATW
jgi:hypothetical protein